jgi:hypothetical protein
MGDNVIEIGDYLNRGNGAREAMIDVFNKYDLGINDAPAVIDLILAALWIRGFKVDAL